MSKNKQRSKRWKLNSEDLTEIGKVIFWTLVSALAVVLLDVVQAIQFPPQYAFVPGIVNSLLVALKKVAQDKRPKE